MENQWWDKPATAETIQKQFPNWHMEGLCDWFWLLLDFNTVHCELIDSQTSFLRFIYKLPNESLSPFSSLSSYPSPSFLWPLFSAQSRESGYVELDMLDKWADDFPQIHPLCNRSQRDVTQFIQIPPLQSNPLLLGLRILHVPSISWKATVLTFPTHRPWQNGISCHHQCNDFMTFYPCCFFQQPTSLDRSLPQPPTPL